ncbi:MAG TPA: hypothetical protein PLY43_04750, partial [Ruminococcus sp.]|nr:hypothetical protein [Ruminococcus sp.]
AAIDLTTSALDFLETPAIAVWEGFLQPISEVAGDVIFGSLDLISKGLGAIADAVDGVDWEGFWIDMFSGDFGEDWSVGWQELKDTIGDCGEAIDEFFNTSEFGEKWNNFWQGVGAKVYDFKENILDPFISDWKVGLSEIKQFLSDVKTGFTDFADAVVAGWDMIGQGIDNFIENYSVGMDMIKDFFTIGEVEATTNPDFSTEGWFGKVKKQAKGGIIRKPTVTLSGEAGYEANIPLYNDNLGIRQIADAITRNMANATNNITINVTAGEGTDAKSLAQRIAEEVDSVLNDRRIAANRAIGGTAW